MTPQQQATILDCIKRQEADFSNRTLARQIISDNPGIFQANDMERVRNAIRYRRGTCGKNNAKKRGVMKEYIREEMRPSEYMVEFMAKSEREPQQDWDLPEDIKKPLIIADTHIPYHEEDVINLVLDYGFKNDIDAVYINGDLIDFYQISRWTRDPSRPRIQQEVDIVHNFLTGLAGLGIPVFWKFGNHEERWNKYLIDNAPELYDLDTLQIPHVMKLDQLGVKIIDSRQKAYFGGLVVIHGHEFGQSYFNPVNPARGLFLRAKTSSLVGHNHQTSKHSESNLNGKPSSCFSTGCLCQLNPDYRPYAFTKWNHGAAIVDVDGKYFNVENFEVIDGRIVR